MAGKYSTVQLARTDDGVPFRVDTPDAKLRRQRLEGAVGVLFIFAIVGVVLLGLNLLLYVLGAGKGAVFVLHTWNVGFAMTTALALAVAVLGEVVAPQVVAVTESAAIFSAVSIVLSAIFMIRTISLNTKCPGGGYVDPGTYSGDLSDAELAICNHERGYLRYAIFVAVAYLSISVLYLILLLVARGAQNALGRETETVILRNYRGILSNFYGAPTPSRRVPPSPPPPPASSSESRSPTLTQRPSASPTVDSENAGALLGQATDELNAMISFNWDR